MSPEGCGVALIEPVGGHGGNEFYDFGLCESLRRDGSNVCLYTCDATKLDEQHQFSFPIKKYYVGIYGSSAKIFRGLRYVRGSVKSAINAKKNKLKIAHFHIYHFSLIELLNVLIFWFFGFKCVSTIHDVHSFEKHGALDENRVGLAARLIIAISRRLMVHSQLAFESLVEIGISEKQIRLVPHGDTDFLYGLHKISREDALKKINHGIDGSNLVLLFFGQIKSVKGLDVLLDAVPHMDERVHVLIVGKCWKQELSIYSRQAAALDVDARVTFVNEFIPNEMVPLYFWASDFVCLPYKKIYSSGVVLRAMDYGCAVIASDLSPLSAVIRHGETGILFESENPSDLAKKVNILASDQSLRDKLAVNAKKFIDENYAWPVIAKATKKVYGEVL